MSVNRGPAKVVLFTRTHQLAQQPSRAYSGDAGWDLYTCARTVIPARNRAIVPTGINAAIPHGFWAHILTRSSTLKKHGLQVISAVIDSGFRGELYVQVYNPQDQDVLVEVGTRLAQIIISEVESMRWSEVDYLPPGSRGTSGFGSSGV